MAARRSGRKQAKRSGGSSGGGVPSWMLVVGGLLGGLAIAGVLWVRSGGSVDDLLPKPNPEARAPAEPEAPVAQDVPDAAPRKPKYEFYDVLRENETVFSDAELNAQAAAEAEAQAAAAAAAAAGAAGLDSVAAAPVAPPPTAAAPDPALAALDPAAAALDPAMAAPVASGPRYLIQAGAFSGSGDAEALKARIAMTGEIARVESAEVNGATIYRVRLGPYPDASTLAAAKETLGGHGIEAVAIRAR